MAYAFALLGEWPLAEDVFQEACLVVMDKWAEAANQAEFFPWVRQIVKLKAFECLRRQRREQSCDGGTLNRLVELAAEENLDVCRAQEHQRQREALRQCMQQMERAEVTLLADFYTRGASCEALAAAGGKSPNAVRLALFRLRARLRQCVRRRLQGASEE